MDDIKQKLNCHDIDFFGSQKINLVDILAYILFTKSKWIDKKLIDQKNVQDLKLFCTNFHFNSEGTDVPQQRVKPIPLLKRSSVKDCKQFVLGRVSQLYSYYKDSERFITLDLPNDIWSDEYTYSMKMNDLFVYCAVNANKFCKTHDPKFFPIRLVLNQRDAFLMKSHVSKRVQASQSQSIIKYDKNPRFGTVLAREVCQLIFLFDCHMYQSTTYPYIFFLKRGPVISEKGLQLVV